MRSSGLSSRLIPMKSKRLKMRDAWFGKVSCLFKESSFRTSGRTCLLDDRACLPEVVVELAGGVRIRLTHDFATDPGFEGPASWRSSRNRLRALCNWDFEFPLKCRRISAISRWRGIYLVKLPGLERKIRVLVDWTIELFFPRDIIQTIDLR